MAEHRIETLDDLKAWVAHHDGQNSAWWDAQWASNAQVRSRLDSHADRITALEKKVMWMAGASAGIGALVGALLPFLIFGGAT